MSDAGSNTVRIEFTGDVDELTKRLAKAIETGVKMGMADVQGEMSRLFSGAEFRKGAKAFANAAEAMQRDMRDVGKEVTNVDKRVATLAKTFDKIKAPISEFEELARAQKRVDVAMEQVRKSEGEAARDPALARHYREVAQLAERAAETQERAFRTLNVSSRTEMAKTAEHNRVSLQGQTTVARAEASERIVLAQQEGSRIAAETRAAGSRRVAIIQAVNQQIRALERGLGAVFRSTANAFGRLVTGAGRAVSRMGGIFSRNDRQLSAGLSGAMTRRESVLRSSMSRQERILQASVTRQSVTVARLERRLSTGIAGAVTGRSAIGGILGGGLAIGGGFAFASLLRNLATAGADFTQALAVLDAQLGLTDRQMKNIRQTALDLGNDITLPGVSAKDAAEAIAILTKQFGSLGKDAPKAAQAAAKGTLQLSRAAETSAESAGRVIGAAVNVFGIEANRAVAVADQITGALTIAAGVGFDQFAQSFQQGASVFAAFQVPALGAEEALTEFNTALAVLARQGLVGSDVGTSMKQFFLSMVRNTAPAKEALGEIADRAGIMGSVFFDEAGNARALSDSLQIMRDGLKDATEQQRLQALSVIFGSDAVRVANALLNTNAEQYEKIRQKILVQGLAAKIAAAQNQGLRGALDALNSVVETQGILVYEKLNIVLGNVVLAFADFANKLLSAGGAFAVARTALKGIAIGLASIFAARGAVEVFRLLLVFARGLLTPFGLLLVAAGLLGAAFTLMTEKSEPFRKAVNDIRESLGNLVGRGVEFAREKLGEFADFLGTSVIPRLAEFAETALTFIQDVFTGSDVSDAWARGVEGVDTRTLGEKIGDKIREIIATAREVFGNVQELLGDLIFGTDFADAFAESITGADTRSRFERIGGEIRDIIVGAFGRVVDVFNTVRDAIASFWRTVEPILRPAIDGFEEFGSAVRELFELRPSAGIVAIGGILAAAVAGFALGGPAGAAIGGLGAGVAALFATGLADNLGSALAGVGDVIMDALRGPIEVVKNFLGTVFSGENLRAVADGFLGVVERIGEILGRIASDPRLIAAVAGLAAFGLVTGARFIEGFIRGVVENIPELTDMLRTVLGEAINQAFNFIGLDIDIGQPIATALLAAFAGVTVIRLLTAAATKLGLTTGGAFGKAIATGTSRALTVDQAGLGGGPKGFLQGLVGDVGSAKRDAARISGAAATEFRRNLRLVEGVGRSTFDAIKASSVSGMAAGVQASQQARDRVVRDFGEVRAAGLRANFAIRDIGGSLRRLNFRGVATGLGDLRAALVGRGAEIGTAVGVGLAAAIGIAFGAEMVRESQGIGDTFQGVLTILGSALLAFSVGGGPLGVFTLAVGGILAVLQDLQGEAQASKERINDFEDAILGAASTAEQVKAVRDALAGLFDAADTRGLEILVAAEVSLHDIAEAALEGGPAVEEMLGGIRTRLQEMRDEGEITGTEFTVLMAILERTFREIGVAAEDANLTEKLIGEGDEEKVRNIDRLLRNVFDTMKAAEAAQAGRNLEVLIQGMEDIRDGAIDAREEIDELFGRAVPTNLKQGIDELIASIPGIASSLAGIDLSTLVGRAQFRGDVTAFVSGFLTEIQEGITEGEITAVPQIRVQKRRLVAALEEFFAGGEGGLTEAERRFITRVTVALEATIDDSALADLLGEAQGKVQEALTALPRGGTAVHGFARGGGAATSVSVPITIDPDISVSTAGVSDIGAGIADLVAAGITSQAGRITGAFNTAIGQAIRSGAAAAGGVASAGAALAGALAAGIASQSGTVASTAATVSAGATVASLSQLGPMSAAGAGLGASFAGGVGSTAGAAGGAGASLGANAVGGAQGYSLYSTGVGVGVGFVSGILAMVSSAYNAGRALGNAAAQGARDALAAQSPSRIFRNLGRDVGRGFVLGIEDSETSIGAAVDRAISDAIERAQRAVPRQGFARAQIAGALFQELLPRQLPGGPTNLDISRALDDVASGIGELVAIERDVRDQNVEIEERNTEVREGITEMRIQLASDIQALRESFLQRVQEAFATRQAETDIRIQRIQMEGLAVELRRALRESGSFEVTVKNAQGEDVTERRFDPTLARTSIRGQANIQTLVDFGQRIRDFGAQLLAQGISAKSATRQMAAYRDQLLRVATSMGFNRKQVLALVQALGLSDAQLRSFRNRVTNIGDSVRQQIREARATANDEIAEARGELQRQVQVSTSLSRGTEAGRTNRATITEALDSIREFGATALEAGRPVNQVIAQMKEMRSRLVQQAVALGFNRDQVLQLVSLMGLSNAQLAEFAENLANANGELTNPPPAPPPGPGLTIGPGGRLPTGFRDLHVHIPFGDPEAVALQVNNRVAFEMSAAG